LLVTVAFDFDSLKKQ